MFYCMLGGVLGTEEKYKIKYQEKSDYNKYKNQYLVRVKNLGYKKKKNIYIYIYIYALGIQREQTD